jgi:outer membrane protein assembly factor BamB
VRSSIVTGLTLQIAALLLMAGLASAQVPAAGSGARMPDAGQQPANPGGQSGSPGAAETARKKAEKERDKEKEKERTGPLRALSIAPLQHAYISGLVAGPVADPAYDDQVYMISIKGKQLGAWTIKNGSPAWYINDITALQPLTYDRRLYVVVEGEIATFETVAGKPLWRVPSGGVVSAPPVAKAGWFIYALDTGEVRALRGETGEQVWKIKLDAPVKVMPVVVGDRLYVATEQKQVVALDVVSGQRLWAQTLDEPIAALAAQEKRLFVSTDRTFLALDHGGDLKWRRRIGVAAIGQPLPDGDTVYVTFADNTLFALGADKGDLRWRAPLTYRPVAGPVRADDALLLVGIAPVLHWYLIKDGKAIPDLPLPGDTRSIMFAPPHVARGATFFNDLVLVPSTLAVEALQRQGPGTFWPFIDLGVPCPPLSFPGEPPPPTTASVPAVPPKP